MNNLITKKPTYTVKCDCGNKRYGIDREKVWTCRKCGVSWLWDGINAIINTSAQDNEQESDAQDNV